MEISTGHHQAMANHQLDHEVLNRHKSSTSPAHHPQQEKKPKPQPEQALRCPRCDSTNTKFCYYNNYSLSQPRYFCKGCRRYWTKGGSLRNVPVGGGCRKNKRSSPSASNSSSTSSKKPALQDPQDMNPASLLLPSMPLPPLTYDPSDLTLAFSSFHSHDPFLLGNPNPNPNPNGPAFQDILRGGDHSQNHGGGGGGLHSFYYGFSGGGGDDIRGMLSFDGGVGGCSDSTTVAAAETTMVGNSNPGSNVHSTSTSHGSLGMESAGRDYWSGVASNSSWHGLINSSLL